jgi:hypothetical protein
MSSLLFHSEVFMPASAKKPIHEGPLRYRKHAFDESRNDRYGQIALPAEFSSSNAQLIEAEVLLEHDQARVVKQLWRQPLDAKRDLVMAILEGGMVKTVWVNLKTDKHRSLDKSRYMRP